MYMYVHVGTNLVACTRAAKAASSFCWTDSTPKLPPRNISPRGPCSVHHMTRQ